ncbi:MAG: glycoside hydrolase family 18 protein, partial [Chlamydiia bacterium]|nr:glycoside hydrolase family 18 protein [Chlamydiia bacterium]
MKKLIFSLVAALGMLTSHAALAVKPVVEGYFSEWSIYGRNYQISNIPADKLTNLIYAFAKIDENNNVVPFDVWAALGKDPKTYQPVDSDGNYPEGDYAGNYKKLQDLKAAHPDLKITIAIGGWTLSEPFSPMAANAASRKHFVESVKKFITKYGFDGVDIDWEYPGGGGQADGNPGDTQNFTTLMQDLRNELGPDAIITVAAPAGDPLRNIQLGQVAKSINYFNLMAYDFHGSSWEKKETNHQSALYSNPQDPSSFRDRYNIDYAVKQYLDAGVPADKIVMGLPLYSRAWTGVSSTNDGLFQQATGPVEGTWDHLTPQDPLSGVLDYGDLANKVSSDVNFKVFWDNDAKVSYVYNAQLGNFYTFDDSKTIDTKLDYIKSNHL